MAWHVKLTCRFGIVYQRGMTSGGKEDAIIVGIQITRPVTLVQSSPEIAIGFLPYVLVLSLEPVWLL